MKQFCLINFFFNQLLKHSIILIFLILRFNQSYKQIFLVPKKAHFGSTNFGNIKEIIITISLN